MKFLDKHSILDLAGPTLNEWLKAHGYTAQPLQPAHPYENMVEIVKFGHVVYVGSYDGICIWIDRGPMYRVQCHGVRIAKALLNIDANLNYVSRGAPGTLERFRAFAPYRTAASNNLRKRVADELRARRSGESYA